MQRSLTSRTTSARYRRQLLKASFMLLAGAASLSFAASAADTSKQALIQKVTIDSMRNTVFTPDSPLLDNMLAPAKTANPNVPAVTWTAVRTETAAAMTEVLFGPDSSINAAMEQSLSQLSVQELQHLDALLTDPVLIKFQHTMASPDTQRAMMQGMASSAEKMQAAMNDVLKRHGLKVPSP